LGVADLLAIISQTSQPIDSTSLRFLGALCGFAVKIMDLDANTRGIGLAWEARNHYAESVEPTPATQ
jgi:hypothetical protein